jgi:hypothetical protein
MSVHKNSTYITNLTHPVMPPVRMSHFQAHFMRFLDLLSGWLARGWTEKSHLIGTVDFELGEERFAEGGYYRISSEQAARERTIDVLSLSVTLTRSR